MTDLVAYEAPWKRDTPWWEILPQAAELARMVGNTDFVPSSMRNRNAVIAACVLYGHELGLPPMHSLAKIAVIEGRPAPSAELARALALGAGHTVVVEEATTTKATVAGHRHGADEWQRVTWTMDDARRAKLDGKNNWRAFPRQMLVARASAELVRNMCPDVLGGITLVAEEVEDGDLLNGQGPAELLPGEAPKGKSRKRSLASVPTPDDEAEADRRLSAEPEADPAEPQGKPTAAQNKKMFALMHDVEANDDKTRLAITSEVVGREVESSKDLTRGEMQLLLDDLERRKAEGWVAF